MMVLDSSAALRIVLGTPEGLMLIDTMDAGELITAPAVFEAETANAIWKYLRAGVLETQTALEKLHEALALVDVMEDMRPLLDEALAEAERTGHPVYDLLYLVLARRSAATLVTFDRRLASLCDRLGVRRLPE